MIIGSYIRLEIGKIYNRYLSDKEGVYHSNTPFLVLRMATKEEYIDYIENELIIPFNGNELFYEVSID